METHHDLSKPAAWRATGQMESKRTKQIVVKGFEAIEDDWRIPGLSKLTLGRPRND